MTYGSWSNHETWAVALWLDNDEGSYTYVREMARAAREESAEDENATPEWILAARLGEMVDEMKPDLGASMFADLLAAALSEVDWNEIAGSILSE